MSFVDIIRLLTAFERTYRILTNDVTRGDQPRVTSSVNIGITYTWVLNKDVVGVCLVKIILKIFYFRNFVT